MDKIVKILLENREVLKHLGPEHIKNVGNKLREEFMNKLLDKFKENGGGWEIKEEKNHWKGFVNTESTITIEDKKLDFKIVMHYREKKMFFCGVIYGAEVERDKRKNYKCF